MLEHSQQNCEVSCEPSPDMCQQRAASALGMLRPLLMARHSDDGDVNTNAEQQATVNVRAWRLLHRLLAGPLGGPTIRAFCP